MTAKPFGPTHVRCGQSAEDVSNTCKAAEANPICFNISGNNIDELPVEGVHTHSNNAAEANVTCVNILGNKIDELPAEGVHTHSNNAAEASVTCVNTFGNKVSYRRCSYT